MMTIYSYICAVILLTVLLSERLKQRKGLFYVVRVTGCVCILAIFVFVVLIDVADLRCLLVAMTWQTLVLPLGVACLIQVLAIKEARRQYLVGEKDQGK